jgi:hypothetical protein
MSLAEIFANFPPELQPSVAQLVEALREEFGVRRTDFDELKAVVRDLAEAQKRTEQRIEELAQTQKELAEAQKRTEQRIEELAEAQKRTEQRIEELAEVQQRTTATLHARMDGLEGALDRFRKTFDSKIGGLGARWGLQTEESFRKGMRAVLQEAGFTAERFLERDPNGEVFGISDQVELDVVVRNGRVIVVEIKSSLSQADLYYFMRKVDFYMRKTGRSVDRKLVVSPSVEPRAHDAAARLGVEICTDVVSLPPI